MRVKSLVVIASLTMLYQATAVVAELPPLIPRKVIFGNPDKASPKISPDGKRLAYLAPDEGVLNVWIRTLGEKDDRAVTHDRDRGIHNYFWAQNNQQIIYIQDKDGDENWHVYAVDLDSHTEKDLTPFDGVQARVQAVDQKFPNEILLGINKRNPQLHDIYRANLVTGELTLEAQNDEGFVNWTIDHNFQTRAAMKMTPNGGSELYVRDNPESAWKKLLSWGPEDVLHSGAFAFTPDNQGLYLINSKGCNAAELHELNLITGKQTVLASDRQYDISNILMHPSKHNIQAVSFTKERVTWKVLDKSIKKDMKAIKRIHRGDFGIINRDHDDATWLIYFNTDDGPIHYYAYDRNTKKAEFLFTNRKALQDVKLARMEPIKFQACCGLAINGYLTLPVGLAARNLPMVLIVHGGPWNRDRWGYDDEAQWLANRGYAVLQINFRGSTGYGKHFLNAANREWGGKMHKDLIDGVNWAIRKGIADPKRVAIFGTAYGGYASLVGLTFTPDVFACGVDIVGPSNLITFQKNIPPYWKPIETILWDRVGHPEKDVEFLRSRSPLFHVDRICKPLLIAQGKNDPRVKRSESLQIVEAMRRAGKEVQYEEYADEGHGFARPENRLDFYAKAEKFLAKHLGGRYEE